MIFPIIQPRTAPQAVELPVCRDAAWDEINNIPVWRDGSPVLCERIEAVKSWASNALQTVRYRHDIYSWDYGNEAETLIGAAYTDDLKAAEAARYIRDCLTVNPYIEAVEGIKVAFLDGRLSISCKIVTVYGEANTYV